MLENSIIDPSVVLAIGSVSTAILAFVIYVQGNRRRKTEWVIKANESWNQFNFFLVNSGSTAIFEAFVKGEKVPNYDQDKFNSVVFSYLNIIYFVWVSKTEGHIDSKFANKMLSDHFEILRRNEDEVVGLLKNRGYTEDFKNEIYSKPVANNKY